MSINYLYLYIDNIEQIEYNNLTDLIMVMFYTVIILIIFMCSLLFYKNQTLNIVKRLDIRLKEKYDFIKLVCFTTVVLVNVLNVIYNFNYVDLLNLIYIIYFYITLNKKYPKFLRKIVINRILFLCILLLFILLLSIIFVTISLLIYDLETTITLLKTL